MRHKRCKSCRRASTKLFCSGECQRAYQATERMFRASKAMDGDSRETARRDSILNVRVPLTRYSF